MNPIKVLRPDSLESFKSRDPSFSAGTEQPSLQDIPWSQRRPKLLAPQSQVRIFSPPVPKEKKSRRKTTVSSFGVIPAGEQDSFLPRAVQHGQSRRLPSPVSVWKEAGTGGQTQRQGKKVGFWVSRVQGSPKPPKAALVPQ